MSNDSDTGNSGIIVNGFGPTPNRVLLVGEAPGETEASLLRPFVGRSGQAQRLYLNRHNLNPNQFYLTNIVKSYIPGNPDPTETLIREWTPTLLKEIATVQPSIILAVGRFAVQFFLGPTADLESCHGLPHRANCFGNSKLDQRTIDQLRNIPILPCYHPASGFYEQKKKVLIDYDYSQFASVLEKILHNGSDSIDYREDAYSGKEIYLDVSGHELISFLKTAHFDSIGLDTEGTPDAPWSIQISPCPGTSYVLRCQQPDFAHAISYLQTLASNPKITFVLHNASTPSGCMYDVQMCRKMGLNLTRAAIYDTMYAAYILRTEPRGLKSLSWRYNGVRLTDYQSLIGDIGYSKQLDYLERILNLDWPKIDPYVESLNDGTQKLKRPKSIPSLVTGILKDIYLGKETKEGPTDPYARWHNLSSIHRSIVESRLGPIPTGNLSDIPLSDAIQYAAGDSDNTLRLMPRLHEQHVLRDTLDRRLRKRYSLPLNPGSLVACQTAGMRVACIFETMQHNGMPASRKAFTSLQSRTDAEFNRLSVQISTKYFNGAPFNPNSPPHVSKLLELRNLKSTKRTPTGDQSTSKKAIEHLRYKDPAIGLMFDAREQGHVRDSFCNPIIAAIPSNLDICNVYCNINISTTEARRLSSENPNLLAVPIRTAIGRAVRECYIAPPGQLFGGYDYSQIELRVLAHESRSKFLCEAFRLGRDIHTETAIRVFGLDESTVLSNKQKYRTPAKTTNFGLIYGEEGPALFEQFRMLGLEGWSIADCTKLKREIFKLFQIQPYVDSIVREAKYLGYVRDYSGMPRYLPNLLDTSDFLLYSEACRHAISHRIQGTAQTLIQNAMSGLAADIDGLTANGLNIQWRLQYHDELILTFDEEIEELVSAVIIHGLEQYAGIKLRVPIVAEGKTGKTWGDLKD